VCVVDNGHRIDLVGVHDRGDARERRIRQNARCPVIEGGPHRCVLHVTGSCGHAATSRRSSTTPTQRSRTVTTTWRTPQLLTAVQASHRLWPALTVMTGLLITVSAVTTSSSGEGVLTIGLESGRRLPGSVAARSARGRPIDASGTHAARDGRSLRDCRPRPPRAGCRRVFRQWTTT
jgi:hypothetical protein